MNDIIPLITTQISYVDIISFSCVSQEFLNILKPIVKQLYKDCNDLLFQIVIRYERSCKEDHILTINSLYTLYRARYNILFLLIYYQDVEIFNKFKNIGNLNYYFAYETMNNTYAPFDTSKNFICEHEHTLYTLNQKTKYMNIKLSYEYLCTNDIWCRCRTDVCAAHIRLIL